MLKLRRRWRELILLPIVLATVATTDWLRALQAPVAFDSQMLATLDSESVSLPRSADLRTGFLAHGAGAVEAQDVKKQIGYHQALITQDLNGRSSPNRAVFGEPPASRNGYRWRVYH